MTKSVQRAVLAEGVALGVIAVHGEGFRFDPPDRILVFAFRHAWRDWSYRTLFADVDVDRLDLVEIIEAHPRQRDAHLFGWASSRPFEPYVRKGYTITEVGQILQKGCGVPLSGWADLAKHFLNYLEPKAGI